MPLLRRINYAALLISLRAGARALHARETILCKTYIYMCVYVCMCVRHNIPTDPYLSRSVVDSGDVCARAAMLLQLPQFSPASENANSDAGTISGISGWIPGLMRVTRN